MKHISVSQSIFSCVLLVSATHMHGSQISLTHSSSKLAPKAQVATAPSWFTNTYNKTYNYVFASRIQQQQKAADDARKLQESLANQKRTEFVKQLIALLGTGPELYINNLAKCIDVDALLACKAAYVKTTEQQDDVTLNRAAVDAYINSLTPGQQDALKEMSVFINHIAGLGHIMEAAVKAHDIVDAQSSQSSSAQSVKIVSAKRNWKVFGVQAGLAATTLIAVVFGFKKAGYKLSPHFKIPFFKR